MTPRQARAQGPTTPLPKPVAQAQPQPDAGEIGHAPRGCGDGGSLAPQAQPGMLRRLPRQARARVLVSTADAIQRATQLATQLGELQPESQRARWARYRRISAAKAPAPSLFLWSCRLRPSCGASSARSSICAYILLVAHLSTTEQSATRGGRDTRGRQWVVSRFARLPKESSSRAQQGLQVARSLPTRTTPTFATSNSATTGQ